MIRRLFAQYPRQLAGWLSFAILLTTYWLTTPATVSYWDCPEYVSAAWLLEIGHPPGNPLWMLVERMVTLLVPADMAAYAVNLSSGVFTAFAGYFLAMSVFMVTLWILRKRRRAGISPATGAFFTAITAALVFGWCDSTWYSAVEAEVYAMSIFFTALSVWLTVKWAFMPDSLKANRMLVLIAYVFGLSIGVHQLNLLAIPALTLVWGLRRKIKSPVKLSLYVLAGMVMVAVILLMIMPGSIAVAAWLELWAVNSLGLPPLSGVALFLLLTGTLLATALAVTSFGHRRMRLGFWMITLFLTGYSVYAIIPIRGDIASPANAAMPGEPFAFAAYQSREQYGAKPLFYGATPYSRPLLMEEYDKQSGKPVYRRYAIRRTHPIYVPYEPGARLDHGVNGLLPEDSSANARVIASGRKGYIVRGYALKNVLTPELDMLLPRITSRNPADLPSYYDWCGMDTASMSRVAVSEVIDSLGRPQGKMLPDGSRNTVYSYKPTLAQNLKMLFTYQIGYMYMRYLMWNFCGRQNDVPSQGEVEHGNFITGINAIDNAMLGAEDSLPPDIGRDNPGRNRYFAIPFILGIMGLLWLFSAGKRGKATAAVTILLFIMTGVAIVVYLNQDPGEPRERDYSFLGSFWTFAIWVAYGCLLLARLCRTPWTFALTLLVPVWMCVENYDDHDRSGRNAAEQIARATLESLEKDAVVFVDGDNFTFPLWYAQEVLGIRTDVRVVNISYLGIPRYAANLLEPWRESEALPLTLERRDIIYNALLRTRVADNRDTLPALEILRRLKRPEATELAARYALLPVAPGDTVVYDLRKLSLSASASEVMFGQLFIFDLLATNADRGFRRPVYWLNNVPATGKLHLPDSIVTPLVYAVRYGTVGDSLRTTLMAQGVEHTYAPAAPGKKVYFDRTPARMAAQSRIGLIKTARRLIADSLPSLGKYMLAAEALYKADILMGSHTGSYPIVLDDNGDILNTRLEMGRMQQALADSLEMLLPGIGDRRSAAHLAARATELRARGIYNERAASRRLAQRRRYLDALPLRLKGVTAAD